MNTTTYAFVFLALLSAILVGILFFAAARFVAAVRVPRRKSDHADASLLTSALEEAIVRLKAQERATAARAEASERLSGEIVAGLTSGLIVVDGGGRVQIVNPAARRILGLGDRALPSNDVLRDSGPLHAVIVEFLASRQPIVRRAIAIERSRGVMHLGVTVSPLAAPDGTGGAICLFSDLTNVVALEEQLRLKEALARLGELTAGLAHEFRNGLATIHGYARLLEPAMLPSPQRPYLDGIRSETRSLGDIVTKFLEFARPDALTLTAVDLYGIAARAAEDFPGAPIQLQGEFAVVDGDEVLLRQALSNLYRNSLEACAAAGVLPRIVVDASVDRAAARARIDVRDNGPGIDYATLGRMFQPFFTTRAGGTGLGLAIVQKVIVSHNGTIAASNHPLGGALFRIAFPMIPRKT